ncbi:MAG: hypothetical protein ABSG05_03445 [Candidatus Pacearchaeota archaeon]|jgi:hypothetical protein
MKKIYLFLMAFLLIGVVSASTNDLGFFAPGSCVPLIQTCSNNCTFNNISSIYVSNGGGTPTVTSYSSPLVMTTTNNFSYNYTYCNTTSLGNYYVNGYGNDGGTQGNWTYQFEIGFPMWLVIVFMIFSYGLAIMGFFMYKNEWISLAGGMMMLLLGIYITSYGISIYNNTLTLAIGYFTIALGGVAALVPIGERLEVDFNRFG